MKTQNLLDALDAHRPKSDESQPQFRKRLWSEVGSLGRLKSQTQIAQNVARLALYEDLLHDQPPKGQGREPWKKSLAKTQGASTSTIAAGLSDATTVAKLRKAGKLVQVETAVLDRPIHLVGRALKNILAGRDPNHGVGHRGWNTSLSNEWYTPPCLVDIAREVLGRIDLDPASCATANAAVGATDIFTQEDDGLQQDWNGTVFLNPPYGGNNAAWINKLTSEMTSGRTTEAVLVLYARTEKKWFHSLWSQPICFIGRPVRFIPGDPRRKAGPASSGVCLVYFGDRHEAFAQAATKLGQVVLPGSSQTSVAVQEAANDDRPERAQIEVVDLAREDKVLAESTVWEYAAEEGPALPKVRRQTVDPLYPHPGGKCRLVGMLMDHIGGPVGSRWLMEPFCGPSSLSLAMVRRGWAKRIWLNDIDAAKVAVLRTVRTQPDDLMEQIMSFSPTVEKVENMVDVAEVPPDGIKDIDLALAEIVARSCTASSLAGRARGPVTDGVIKRGWRPDIRTEAVQDAHDLLRRVDLRFTRRNALDVIDTEESAVIYADPPYVTSGEVYRNDLTVDDHRALADALTTSGHPWLLSYGDHQIVRTLYEGQVVREAPAPNNTKRPHDLLIGPGMAGERQAA